MSYPIKIIYPITIPFLYENMFLFIEKYNVFWSQTKKVFADGRSLDVVYKHLFCLQNEIPRSGITIETVVFFTWMCKISVSPLGNV